MQFNKRILQREADKYHYVRDTYEKVIRLVYILDYINTNPFLNQHLALKGGTAINLTIFDLPRLSVDLDFDFTGDVSREEMLTIRNEVNILILNHLKNNEYIIGENTRIHYALDSFKIYYINAGGNSDSIKIEINYMLRNHIYNPITVTNKQHGLIPKINIRSLNPIEIYGSKMVALMTRSTPRDLYDILYMIHSDIFTLEDINKIKKCSVFYRAISNEDGNYDYNLNNLSTITQNQIKRFLLPVINSNEFFCLDDALFELHNYFNHHFILNSQEQDFLIAFQNKRYLPQLLFEDEELKRIINHPMAIWKTNKQRR